MKPNPLPSELKEAVLALKPHFWRAFGFALVGALLVLAPTAYMFEVYDRVVNSRSYITLGMLILVVVLAYIVMEVLDWARSETMREAGQLPYRAEKKRRGWRHCSSAATAAASTTRRTCCSGGQPRSASSRSSIAR